MSWYVLQCKPGREKDVIQSCCRHLTEYALESAFVFQTERLWRVDGKWRSMEKDMFPGYVFLQSSHPKTLSRELEQYRGILRIMEDKGYLFSLYADEQEYLQKLCGDDHILRMSYGYIDKTDGISRITEGPLKDMQNRIIRIDWHRRFAQIEIGLLRRKAVVWAGLSIAGEAMVS